MSYRVQCSACGKVMVLEEESAGERLVCIACGTRLEAPPPPVPQPAPGPADPSALALVTAAAESAGGARAAPTPSR